MSAPKRIKQVFDNTVGDAKSFFERFALPNVRDFEASPANERLGLNAALMLGHMCEWYWYDSHPDKNPRCPDYNDGFLPGLYRECPELKWLADIAEATKHRGIGRGTHSITRVSTLAGRHGVGGVGVGMGYNVAGAVGSGTPELRVYCDDDTSHWLGDIIEAVKNYWISKLSVSPSRP
jgi:hypothetical protein